MATENNPKKRTPNKCRQWEKERRNRFNEAVCHLGELVKQYYINDLQGDNNNDKDQAVQFPKIEIIQKAIAYIKKFIEEKSLLKAEILALQVKLDSFEKQKENKKDASTEITKATKLKCSKYNKHLILKKCNNDLKPEIKTSIESAIKSNVLNLPLLLPKSNISSKRPTENTIVVLPAPYVIPPRPLLLPTAPPAFVLVDANPQNVSYKTSIPVVTRNGSEVTKTTMVNILPISAYSHPLSLNKSRKNISKTKPESTKKVIKSSKNNKRVPKPKVTVTKESITNKENKQDDQIKQLDGEKSGEIELINTIANSSDGNPNVIENTVEKSLDKNNAANKPSNVKDLTVSNNVSSCREKNKPNDIKTSIENNKTVNDVQKVNISILDCNTTSTSKHNNPAPLIICTEVNNIEDKQTIMKEKHKLPPILETTLCENTVDGGNARLELAEEFLAASPTAAFLMSFPLVSGNRADSPADEGHTSQPTTSRESAVRRTTCVETPQPDVFYSKTVQPVDIKCKSNKSQSTNKSLDNSQKVTNNTLEEKQPPPKVGERVSTENPYVSISTATMVSSSLTDTTYSMDFDCNLNKSSIPNQSSSYATSNNLFYNKGDPFNSVKTSIYNSSNISSGHDFNSLSLYPCAMEKYTAKNKADYTNVEENLMKIGSSRLTYDIDLGWSHKTFDFVNNCTTSSSTFSKDNIFTTVSTPFTTVSTPFTTFNPEFHVSLGTTPNKKDNSNKSNSNYTDAITNFYSQPSNFWPEELPLYGNNNVATTKSLSRQQPYISSELHSNSKQSNIKTYDSKINDQTSEIKFPNQVNSSVQQHGSDKFSKKSPNKMHINWMTSETRPIQPNNYVTSLTDMKEPFKSTYGQFNQSFSKKHEHNDSSYFPIPINNFTTQIPQEEFHVWPASRPLGNTTEISIDPPPINLPTLVGDLALGPHDKKKSDQINKGSITNTELTNCNNFLSVTQLMNRTSENQNTSRYQTMSNDIATSKANTTKQTINSYTNEILRKTTPRLDSNYAQSYVFDEKGNPFDPMSQYLNSKPKASKADKLSKTQKNSYSAESLIRSGTQKLEPKFVMPTQKYNNFNSAHDGSVAQVSHFPPIIDYSDNSYAGQQLGTSHLYSSTTSTISNSFYSNFMTGNYPSGNFTGDFIDYNQGVDCNYANQKYEEFKMRNNPTVLSHDKVASTSYRNARRETATKHKLECSKKESNKKCPNKKSKMTTEVEDWPDNTNMLWQNRNTTKKSGNVGHEELSFPNYHGNQVAPQYQTEFFNSHLMPTNVQGMSHNVDRSVTTYPGTSRTNFNLSTIFPEITMKVQ